MPTSLTSPRPEHGCQYGRRRTSRASRERRSRQAPVEQHLWWPAVCHAPPRRPRASSWATTWCCNRRWMGSVGSISNSGGRKWTQIFDHQGWAQDLPQTKENDRNQLFSFNSSHKLCWTLTHYIYNIQPPIAHLCSFCSARYPMISVISLGSSQSLYPALVFNQIRVSIFTTRVTSIDASALRWSL